MKWFGKLITFTFIIVTAAVVLGYIRTRTCFIPGLKGLFAGMILGAVIGSTGKDAEEIYSFSRRIRLSVGFGFMFMIAETVTVSALLASSGDNIFTWLGRVIEGRTAEFFFSMGGTKYSGSSASGNLDGFWWIFMNIMDLCLFSFGFLAGLMLGLPSGKDARYEYSD